MLLFSLVAFFGGSTVFCTGDGIAPHMPCPCGNNSSVDSLSGCLNSFSPTGGATLRASGTASLSADTVVLHAGGLPLAGTLFYQGTTRQNGGIGSVFGDGLRCAGGSVFRLGAVNATGVPGSAVASYPGASDPSITMKGHVTSSGTRSYQACYRSVGTFCASTSFNLSNGVEITWTD
jgi:hypothetical protein